MKKIVLIVVCLLWYSLMKGQNLVLNPSFEDTVQCPNNISQISRCLYWSNPLQYSTPDYFNECDGNGLAGVPSNFGGYQNAHIGYAYAGIITGDTSYGAGNFREYIEGQLINPLIAGVNYCVSFYVSAYDSAGFVSNDIGAYFSTIFIQDTCINWCVLPFTPQIENSMNNSLSSRTAWTEVSGSFTASGGESYIIIGNFKDSVTTTMTYVGWSSTGYFPAYYVDDVSVMPCDSLTGIKEPKSYDQEIKVTPNPSNGLFFISANHNDSIYEAEVITSLGKTILNEPFYATSSIQIDLSTKNSGVYILKLKTKYKQFQIKLIKY